MSAVRLVLFDIDGTLLSASGVSRAALVEALVAHFGTTGPIDGYDFSGKTDPQIVVELMRGAGVAEENIRARLSETLDVYRHELLSRLAPSHVQAKPGVLELIERLARLPEVVLGLLTGNLEPCARAKLAPLDLNRRFDFGAYGSDHEDRYRLPAVAVARAESHTGRRFAGKSVVIVGDSVHDVLCGRSLGVKAVAVATGRTTSATLAANAPDALVSDFSDTERALDVILGGD